MAGDRGVALPLSPHDELTESLKAAMEACVAEPERHRAMAERGAAYAAEHFNWDFKARYTAGIYRATLASEPLDTFTAYR